MCSTATVLASVGELRRKLQEAGLEEQHIATLCDEHKVHPSEECLKV